MGLKVNGELVYLYVLTGNPDKARDLVSSRFPGARISEISHPAFRGGNFIERFRILYRSHGRAFVFFYRSLA
ncbi:MAG: hypothetical protein WBX06_18275, partial [Acidobacteriaceae bacterium]